MASPPVLPPLPLSSSWFNSTPPESAPNRGGALTGSKKFGTVSGPLSSERRHRGGLGFFSPDAPGDENERPAVAQIDEELKDLAGLGRGAEDGWSISVAEHHASRTKTRGKKVSPRCRSRCRPRTGMRRADAACCPCARAPERPRPDRVRLDADLKPDALSELPVYPRL